MITTSSRYYGQQLLTVPTGEGTSAVAVFRSPPGASSRFFYYTVMTGDRFDTIANDVYGSPQLWWRLADANPEVFYPEAPYPGTIIRIPS